MALKTKIEYVSATHNFFYGCTKISEGCKNCFAETMYKRFFGKDFSVPIKSKNFNAPLKWKKPQVILVNDMSDFFHKDVPYEWQLQALDVMEKSKQHIFLLLTKRQKNMRDLFSLWKAKDIKEISNNIWLGVSVENQKTADERIPELLKIPHFKKWLSVEPLLEEINIRKYLKNINWVVCGGETGKGARPVKREWINHLLNGQCKFEGVPFFMKQMSNKEPIPKDLMIREYPKEIKDILG